MVAHRQPTATPVYPNADRTRIGPPSTGTDRLKRACDLSVGLVMLVAAVPVIAAAWIAVRLTSRGPGFYSQMRVGRNGRHYRIYKIRTMYHNCELTSGIRWCKKHDSRITPIGSVLRKLHVDELPQLWNVLIGDMSLVGPRPERPELVGPLAAMLPGYAERHLVRPGLTGLAQIQLPADTDVESVRRKLVLDRCYVGQCMVWLDVRIMFGTVVYLCGFSYASVRRMVRLPNPLPDEDGRVQTPSQGPTHLSDPNGIGNGVAPAVSAAPGRTPIACGEA